jgi:hypothetical protein
MHNDDPLTFFCENEWWKNPQREGQNVIPIGGERSCPSSQEIPVGQTVDNALNWANGIISIATNETNSIAQMVYLLKKIGEADKTNPIQDYCKCNAKFLNANPICHTDCEYDQWLVPILDADGNPTGQTELNCSCSFLACDGSPCKQLIIYLSQVWNTYRQLKLNYIDLYTTMLKEPRSDIMKELAYSRQMTNSCSVVQNNFGNQARMLDCTRAEDENITNVISGSVIFQNQQVPHYCYGKALGQLFSTSLSDNWFCCDLQKINTSPAK